MEISEIEYKRLKAIEAAHLRAVEVQSKWRANCAVHGMGIYLDLLNELRGALMNTTPNNACTRPASAVGTQGESLESAGG